MFILDFHENSIAIVGWPILAGHESKTWEEIRNRVGLVSGMGK
jgi:hypothetical protein